MDSDQQILDLMCHPSILLERARSISVMVRRSAGGELQLTFRLDGDIPRIMVAPPSLPRGQLWRHTCFEAFIALDGQSGYHEFNFAPSEEWAVYAFSSYRNGGPLTDELIHP